MRAGVIGLGVGEQHIIGYRGSGIIDIHVCDFNDDKARLVAARDGLTSWPVSKWQNMVVGCDIVSVASWDQYHAEQVCYALECRKAVMCEKPLCLTREELDRIKAIPGRLACNFPLLQGFLDTVLPYYDDIRQIDLTYNWGRAYKLAGWRAQCPNYSIVHGAGSHLVSLIETNWGSPETVVANGTDTRVQAILTYPEDRIATLDINCGEEGQHQHILKCITTDGSIAVHSEMRTDKSEAVRQFAVNVMNGEDCVAEREHAINVMEICLRIQDAVNENQVRQAAD